MFSFSPYFKLSLTALAVTAAMLCGAGRANAQSVNTNGVDSRNDAAAVNSGVSTTFNSYGTPLSVVNSAARQDLHSNQAFGVAPSFSSPAVIGTCATAGTGVALQLVGGGASYSGGGATELGCDLERDLRIMKQVNATQDDAIERVCMKPEIAKAMKVCRDKAAQTSAATSTDPYIAARLEK